MNPLISIIIPVFNTELWLSECLDTVLNQTFTNFEILLIDDGSVDNSGFICDKYASLDERVSVFHIQNVGVSRARNFGLEHSSGQYICFVDSDDTIHPNLLEVLVNEQYRTKVDWIISGYITKYEKTNTERAYQLDSKVNYGSVGNLFVESDMKGIFFTNCGKLYLKSLLDKYSIKFSSNHTMGEDFLFNKDYLLRISSYATIGVEYYYYRMVNNSQSLINKYRHDYFDINIYLLQTRIKICSKLGISNEKYFEFLNSKKYEIILLSIINLYKPDCTETRRTKYVCFEKYRRYLSDFKFKHLELKNLIIYFILRARLFFLIDFICTCYYTLYKKRN